MKKPDAITVTDEDNFREKVWPLPVSELLYVDYTTTRKLMMLNIRTIGDLANCDPSIVTSKLCKSGAMLWTFAIGKDQARVMAPSA